MSIQSPTRPSGADGGDGGDDQRGGLTARVLLGRVFTPVPNEFVLIASTAIVLTIFGLVMVLSATSASAAAAGLTPFDTVIRQGTFALIGLPLMFVASRLPVAFWKRIAWPFLGLAIGLQLLVFVPGLGVEIDGNRNWIRIAGQSLQPSEFLKLALCIWIGFVLYRKRTMLGIWHHVFIPLVPVSVFAIGTVMAGHDLGTVMIMLLIVLGCLFFAGVKLRLFILPAIFAVVVAGYFATTNENRMARLMSFADPNCDPFGECFQALHGVFGLAQGGVLGLGLGNSKEKYAWLPAAENDYIFAIVGEELGLVGCIVVLALFALFAVGAFHIIRKTDDPFVRIVAGGITVWITAQALINIGVVLRVFPVLGVPLPFMSQGGTALVSVLLATGVLLSLARSLPASPAAAVAQAPRGRLPR